jgi:hypothetical protein
VLFMEGEGEPAELAHLVRHLRSTAADFNATGEWRPRPCRPRGTSPPR